METENINRLAIAWKREMSDKLSNTVISHDGSGDFKIDKNIWDPNLVMKERHKMAHRPRIHQIKFLPFPKETIFVEASKLIRKENSEMLTNAKEERMVKRAIHTLEKNFSEYRNSTKLSLTEFERLNKRKEKARFTKNAHAFEKSKQIDSEQFLKNFQQIYKSIHCQTSYVNNQSAHTACSRGLDKSYQNLKNLTDKKLKRDCQIFPYGDVIDVENNGNKLTRSQSTENESDFCECEDEENKVYPSPTETPSNNNCKKETALQTTVEVKGGINSNFFHKFQLLRYWKAWRKYILRARNDKEKLVRINKIDSFLKRLTEKVYDSTPESEKLCAVKHSNATARKCTNSVSANEMDKHLDRIEDELNRSAVEAYEHLRKGLKTFHPKLRPKAKALSALPNIDKTSYRTEITRKYPIPSFLVRMENRYKERKKRWEDIDRRKREIQAEKEQIEKEREEEKMRMEELRKKEKLEELIKKRLERKKAEEERNMRKEEVKKKIRLAQEHYVKYLTRRIGFEPWKNLVEMRCAQLQEADRYFQMRTTKMHMKYWRNFTLLQIKSKREKADKIFNHNLLKRSFTLLINDYNESVKKLQVALDWWDAKFTEKIFNLWLEYTKKERWDNFRKEEVANANYNRVITNKYFTKWKMFPEHMRYEKQKEIRRRLLQRRVQEFLPDYQPAHVSDCNSF